jgi:hypothetical protein
MSVLDTNHILSFQSIRSNDIDELSILVKPWDLDWLSLMVSGTLPNLQPIRKVCLVNSNFISLNLAY